MCLVCVSLPYRTSTDNKTFINWRWNCGPFKNILCWDRTTILYLYKLFIHSFIYSSINSVLYLSFILLFIHSFIFIYIYFLFIFYLSIYLFSFAQFNHTDTMAKKFKSKDINSRIKLLWGKKKLTWKKIKRCNQMKLVPFPKNGITSSWAKNIKLSIFLLFLIKMYERRNIV